jgi:phage gpG-like protein
MTPDELAQRLTPEAVQAMQRTLLQRVVLTVEGNVKRSTPVKTGNLRRSITSRVEAAGERGVVGTAVTYARAVHEGTKPHDIVPVHAKALAFKIGGTKIVRQRVHHPGTKAQPFLTDGLAASRDTIDDLLAQAGAALWAQVTR